MSDPDDARLDVRRFRRGDGERVRDLNERAMAETPEWVPDAPDEDLLDVRGNYLDAEGEFLVGTIDGELVATGAYTTPSSWKHSFVDIPDDTAELTRMRVDPAHQGRGIGSALFRELERRALVDGYRHLVLDTGAANDVARGFYEAHGFECRAEVELEFQGEPVELALYAKSIAP